MSEMQFEEATPCLRFINRDGRMILQQQIAIKKFTTAHQYQIGRDTEWRDVPVVTDPQ